MVLLDVLIELLLLKLIPRFHLRVNPRLRAIVHWVMLVLRSRYRRWATGRHSLHTHSTRVRLTTRVAGGHRTSELPIGGHLRGRSWLARLTRRNLLWIRNQTSRPLHNWLLWITRWHCTVHRHLLHHLLWLNLPNSQTLKLSETYLRGDSLSHLLRMHLLPWSVGTTMSTFILIILWLTFNPILSKKTNKLT
jgi:hypothetical protein